MEKNPHAASGTGSPRNPYLYDSMPAYYAGTKLDPFSLHALDPKVKEAFAAARAKVLDSWSDSIQEATTLVLAGKEVPGITITVE